VGGCLEQWNGEAMNDIARRVAVWWLHRRANTALIFKRYDKAIEAYREMLEVHPNNEFAGLVLANLLSNNGDIEGAVAVLNRLLLARPQNADAWFNLGFLHDKSDRLEEAERCFKRAVELKPNLDRAWYGLGLVLVRADRLEEAVEAFKETVKLQPFSPYGYYQLGMTYHHLGRSDEAWKVHTHLTGFEPKFSATLKRDLEQTPSRAAQSMNNNRRTKEETATEAT
jgi:tetratricopeptide (TPR) repeat protein